MDTDNSFYVKFIAPTFFGYIISVLAMVFADVIKGWSLKHDGTNFFLEFDKIFSKFFIVD